MPGPNVNSVGRIGASRVLTKEETLLKLILSMGVRCFVDATGEPCLQLPGESLDRAFPIQSRRALAFFAVSAWKYRRMVPGTAELDRVIRVLEGRAWELTPRDATRDQLWHSLQDRPVLHVVNELMRDHEKYEAQVHALLNNLEEIAVRHKFDVHAKNWPKTAAHLSAQLRQEQNRAILKQLGIAIEIKRDRNGAKVVLSRVTPSIPGDDEEQAASPPASLDKPKSENGLAACDACDGETHQQQLEEQIRSRLHQNTNSKQKGSP